MKFAALLTMVLIGYVFENSIYGSTHWRADNLVPFYVTFLISHIILSTTAVLGAYSCLQDLKKLGIPKGPVAATICFDAITGIMVYTLLYIIYPGGSTAGLFDAIFH